jgi:hypothetical protein
MPKSKPSEAEPNEVPRILVLFIELHDKQELYLLYKNHLRGRELAIERDGFWVKEIKESEK